MSMKYSILCNTDGCVMPLWTDVHILWMPGWSDVLVGQMALYYRCQDGQIFPTLPTAVGKYQIFMSSSPSAFDRTMRRDPVIS